MGSQNDKVNSRLAGDFPHYTGVLLVGLLVVAGVFSIGITNGHVGLDDWGYTSGCPFVRGGLSWANISRAFCDFGYGAIWMPVTFMSYMFDVSLFGDSWYAYHAVNVVLHLINTWLVFLFIRDQSRLFVPVAIPGADVICAVCALLWALHPMRAEGVTFVAARKEELWTLFALCGLLQYSRFLKGGGGGRYFAVVLLFVLSGLSKPTSLCFPFLALSMHLALWNQPNRKSLLWLAPLVVMSFALGCLTVYSQSHPTNGVSVDVYDAKLWWRLLNAVVATGLYFWYTVVPLGIHMDYRAIFNGWPIDGWLGIICFGLVSACCLLVFLRRGSPLRSALTYSLLLFLFSLGPTLGVLGYVNGDQSMADRYLYFPHVAVALMVAIGLIRLTAATGRYRQTVVVLLLVAVVEATFAVPVVKSYENGYKACLRALEKDPDNWRALRIVGNEFCARQNRMDEGIAMLRKSLKIRGSQLTTDSLAYILALRGGPGDFDEVKRWGAPMAAKPSLDEGGMMLDALGIVAMREGQYDLAVRYFSQGLSVRKRNHSKDFTMLWLGLNLANVGRDAEAIRVLASVVNSKNEKIRKRATESLDAIRSGTSRSPFAWE